MLNRIVLSCFKIPNRNFRCFRIERWFPVLAIDSDGLRESFRACNLQAVSHQFTSTQGISTDVARLVLIYRHSSTCNCNHCDLPKVNKPKLTRIDLSTFAKLLSAHLTAKHYLLSRLLFGDKTVCNRFKKNQFQAPSKRSCKVARCHRMQSGQPAARENFPERSTWRAQATASWSSSYICDKQQFRSL